MASCNRDYISHVIPIVFVEIWFEFGTLWFKFTKRQKVAELVIHKKHIDMFADSKHKGNHNLYQRERLTVCRKLQKFF